MVFGAASLRVVRTSWVVGKMPVMSMVSANAPAIARLSCRLMDETNTPAASEKKSVLRNTRTMRQNSPGVTPPRVNVTASTGKMANTP